MDLEVEPDEEDLSFRERLRLDSNLQSFCLFNLIFLFKSLYYGNFARLPSHVSSSLDRVKPIALIVAMFPEILLCEPQDPVCVAKIDSIISYRP